MIQFEWLWVFLALPVPWLVRHFLPPARREPSAALRTPFMEDLVHAEEHGSTGVASHRLLWVALLIWLLLLAAAARPQWIGDPVPIPASARDLMLAVDLSGSMEAEDFVLNGRAVDRLTATKEVAGDFIERRMSDRIGLVLFGENAYLQTPLTFDHKTVHSLLMESAIGLAGKKTAIGDAIGLAVKRLRETKSESRVLILLTDGANTAGEVSPIKAAQLAVREGLKIYTIGVGADKMVVQTLFGQRLVNPSQDLDEDTLRKIAELTGGQYFRARNTRELERIYQFLDELEPMEVEELSFRPRRALFHWPLGMAVLLSAAIVLIRANRGDA